MRDSKDHGAMNMDGSCGTRCPNCHSIVYKENPANPRCDTVICTQCQAHFCFFCALQRDPRLYRLDHHGTDHFGRFPYGPTEPHAVNGGWCRLRFLLRAEGSLPPAWRQLTGVPLRDAILEHFRNRDEAARPPQGPSRPPHGPIRPPPSRPNTQTTSSDTPQPRPIYTPNTDPDPDPNPDPDPDPEPEPDPDAEASSSDSAARSGRGRAGSRSRSHRRDRVPEGFTEPQVRQTARRRRRPGREAREREARAGRTLKRALRSIPKPLWKLFVECCRPALQRFEEASAREDDDAMEAALSEFLSLPERLLSVPSGGRQARNRRRNINIITQNMNAHVNGTPNDLPQSPPAVPSTDPASQGRAPQARLVRGRELSQAESERASAVRRGVALERAGHTSRGVRALHDEGLLDTSQSEHLQSLRELHPSCDRPLPRAPPASSSAVLADDHFAKIWRSRLATGQPGPVRLLWRPRPPPPRGP